MVAKQRDMVSLSFLAHSRDVPDQLRLKEHSLSFVGHDASMSAGLITGVYGAHSKQTALVAASNWSRQHQAGSGGPNRILMIDVNYRVDNYNLTREQAREETVKETGWLHLERTASSYREEIKETWISWIDKDVGPAAATSVKDMSLVDIAARYPRFVAMMLKKDKAIRGIVHPVNPSLDPDVNLWVATVRYDKERFESAAVRYLPHVTVIL